jgi:N-acetyl sugar amidotransferase
MPETKPGISFDDRGVCNACQYHEAKSTVDWDARWAELEALAAAAKKQAKGGYNCAVAVSGGKDSTFIALTARDRLGLTPLCICVEPCYPTARGQRNLRNLSRLGFDIFSFQPNQRIMPTLLKRSFVEDGQPARAFEFMLYSVPVRVVMNYHLPLLLWGEDVGHDYGNVGAGTPGDAAAQKDQPALAGADAGHWLVDGVVGVRDLVSFQHPTVEEIAAAGVSSHYLGHYLPWDSRDTAAFAIEHGLEVRPDWEVWESGGYWPFEQLDDEIPVISHRLKYIKFGYGRATDQACRDIRHGYITREQGLRLARVYDGQINPDYIARYCRYIGISIQQFLNITDAHRGDAWHRTGDGWALGLDYD